MNKASPGRFRVVVYANFGGPYHGSRELGEYASLAEAQAAIEAERASYSDEAMQAAQLSFAVYDDQGQPR